MIRATSDDDPEQARCLIEFGKVRESIEQLRVACDRAVGARRALEPSSSDGCIREMKRFLAEMSKMERCLRELIRFGTNDEVVAGVATLSKQVAEQALRLTMLLATEQVLRGAER